MEGKSAFSNFLNIRENLYQFIETRLLYYKLIFLEKASRAITKIVASLVTALLVLIAFLFLSGAAAYFIGSLFIPEGTDNIIELASGVAFGMLIVGGFYLLLGLILYWGKFKIFSPGIIKSLAKSLFEKEEEERK